MSPKLPRVHAKPPVPGAIPTLMGWRHPQTNELLVSVRGLLDDKAIAALAEESQSTVSAEPVAESSVETLVQENVLTATEGSSSDSGEGGEGEAQETEQPQAAFEYDNALFKFEKTSAAGVVKVTLRAPNHHAYTKWVVGGVEIEGVRGNVAELAVDTQFIATNAKGNFPGQVIAVE